MAMGKDGNANVEHLAAGVKLDPEAVKEALDHGQLRLG